MKIVENKHKKLKTDKVKNLFDIKRGKVISNKYIKDNPGCYNVYSSSTSNKGILGKISTFNISGESLTWTTDGYYAGTVFHRTGEYNCTNVCGILKQKNTQLNMKYFSYLFNSIFYKYVIKTDNRKLMSNIVENINFQYVENIKQQENIAYVLSTQEEQIERIKGLIKKLEKRNQYYAEKLLSGELRIRENAETGETEFYENKEWQEVVLNGEISNMPLGWYKGIFSEHSNFTVGTPINSKNFNYDKNGLMYLRTGDIWDDASSRKEIAYFSGEVNEKFIKKENDYLISLKGYNKRIGEGTLGLVTNFHKKTGIVCDNLYLVTPKEHNLVAYTAYVTRLRKIQNIILKSAVGSTARFATKMVNKIEWIFPNDMKYMLFLNEKFKSFDNEIYTLQTILSKEEKRFQWMLDNLLSGEYEVVED